MNTNPYTKGLECRVFDIETSGLYPEKAGVISASFISPDGSGLWQLYAESPKDEERVVKEIIDEFSRCDAIIGYNSNRFDLPFVLNRARKYGICSTLPLFWSIDVYRWLKSYWPMAERMEHLRQKDVEFALGLSEERDDLIGGAECIELYVRWLAMGDSSAKDKILLHNGDDVRQLARITQNMSFMPWHKIAYEQGFFISDREKIKISGISKKASAFEIKAKTVPGRIPSSIFEDEFQLEYDSDSGAVSLLIYPQKHEKQLFIDLEKLPFDTSLFNSFAGFKSGYLLLKDADNIMYREINELVKQLIIHLLF